LGVGERAGQAVESSDGRRARGRHGGASGRSQRRWRLLWGESPTGARPASGSMAGPAVNPERGHSLPFPSGWRTRRHEPSAGEQGCNTVVSEVGHADASQAAAVRATLPLVARRRRPRRWRSGCSRTGAASDPQAPWLDESVDHSDAGNAESRIAFGRADRSRLPQAEHPRRQRIPDEMALLLRYRPHQGILADAPASRSSVGKA
jgi:hypothetical protein